MAGVPAGLPAGVRVSDHISLGVIAKTFPPERVQQVLTETGKGSVKNLGRYAASWSAWWPNRPSSTAART